MEPLNPIDICKKAASELTHNLNKEINGMKGEVMRRRRFNYQEAASNTPEQELKEPNLPEAELRKPRRARSIGESLAAPGYIKLNSKILHFDLYSTDGYINIDSGAWPPANDSTSIAGWGPDFNGPADSPENLFPVATQTPGPITGPIYVWGFTDIDPDFTPDNGATYPNRMTVPPGAAAPAGGPVGNAKVPAPFIECMHMDNVFVTLHNRGFLQVNQAVQDDHSIHWHGIHAQSPYDGFPESAGGYVEKLRYFWQESWYVRLGNTVAPGTVTTTKQRDDWWNALNKHQQETWLNNNAPLIKENRLNPSGAVINIRNKDQIYPFGVKTGSLPAGKTEEDVTQFTYYFSPMHAGSYMYHCHVAASEHVQMGMYGALIVRPMDYNPALKNTWTVLGRNTSTNYDVEYTIVLSEFDARWHKSIEGDPAYANYYAAQWRPDIWMANGRTFPTTLLPFAWNKLDNNGHIVPEYEPRYNMYVKTQPKQNFLIRWIHMGYQTQPVHQHGWHMRIVAKDGMAFSPQRNMFTVLIGSGETYDAITTVDPAYGVTAPAGSPLSSPHPDSPSANEPGGTLKWRILYPVHIHDDYKVTTNAIYPGGSLILIETCVDPKSVPKVPAGTGPDAKFYHERNLGRMSWEDPYVPPHQDPSYTIPIPPDRGDIEEVPSPCPGLPPH